MDIALLLNIGKLLTALLFVVWSLILLVLAYKSSLIKQALQAINIVIHGASAAILSQGSIIMATILPLLFRNRARRSNIWLELFKFSPFTKKLKAKKLIQPINDLIESIISLYRSLR